jgi:hypothetical protein
MLASGSYEPESPYFFIHEYKRMKQSEADPLGQLLIAMIAARTINADEKPIYGCHRDLLAVRGAGRQPLRPKSGLRCHR